MCSAIGSTKRPPKRLQKQVRETESRPSCKPGSCEETGMGESGAPAGSAEDPEEPTEVQRPRVAKSVANQRPKNSRRRGTSSNRSCGARVLVWTLHPSSSSCSSIPNSFTRWGEWSTSENSTYHHSYGRTRFVLSELSAILHQRDWLSQNHLETW